MDLIFCKLQKALKNIDKSIFCCCKLKKAQNTCIYFFASLKNMDLIFCKLKKFKKHGFNFLQAKKISKEPDLIFCKLQKAQKTWI